MQQATGVSQSPSTTVAIRSLSDDLLSRLFTYLSPEDRFWLAKVCLRWASISRTDWTDIIYLDLSPISPENIGPIIRLCPKLDSITAQDCEFDLKSITRNLRSECELKSLRLSRVSAKLLVRLILSPEEGDHLDRLCEAACNELRLLTHLKELVLHDLPLAAADYAHFDDTYVPNGQLPTTLTRLQLSSQTFLGWERLSTLRNLACLILDESDLLTAPDVGPFLYQTLGCLCRLTQLRELCLGSLFGRYIERHIGVAFVRQLTQLEILCLDICSATANISNLAPLFTAHPALRILLITGQIEVGAGETIIPPRRRFPNGFGSDPLPTLHVLIGGQIAEKIRFARAPNDALEIHPITLPMPAFLEQPEVAAIFKGSWIAEMIKKGAKANARLWDYDKRIAQSFLFL